MRYLKGDGVEKDEAAGMKLLEESARQDYTLADLLTARQQLKKKLEELGEKKKK